MPNCCHHRSASSAAFDTSRGRYAACDVACIQLLGVATGRSLVAIANPPARPIPLGKHFGYAPRTANTCTPHTPARLHDTHACLAPVPRTTKPTSYPPPQGGGFRAKIARNSVPTSESRIPHRRSSDNDSQRCAYPGRSHVSPLPLRDSRRDRRRRGRSAGVP